MALRCSSCRWLLLLPGATLEEELPPVDTSALRSSKRLPAKVSPLPRRALPLLLEEALPPLPLLLPPAAPLLPLLPPPLPLPPLPAAAVPALPSPVISGQSSSCMQARALAEVVLGRLARVVDTTLSSLCCMSLPSLAELGLKAALPEAEEEETD